MTDPTDRIPCVDEMCTGTLNEEGVCNYCGRRADGGGPADAEGTSPSELAADRPGEDERIPCIDDLCTGTVNERGVCNYCGKPHPGYRRG
jgi:hypothetical protein